MMITMTAETWQIGLSGFEQITFYNFIDLIMTLANAVETLTNNCIIEITANEKRCKELLNASVRIATVLCPYIEYKKWIFLCGRFFLNYPFLFLELYSNYSIIKVSIAITET